MVKVVYTTKNDQFKLIRIEGHAGYAQQDFDIVCAGISSVVEGTQSFFKTKYHQEVVITSDKLGTTFSVVSHHQTLQGCLQMFIHQLANISHFYPDYIMVNGR